MSPLRILHHAYFQSRMKYGFVFWLTDSYSKKVFCLKKKLCLIFGIKERASYRNSFKAHKISNNGVNLYFRCIMFYKKVSYEY